MIARRTTFILALALAAGIVHADEDDTVVPFQAVVRLAPGVTISDINQRYGSSTLESIDGRNWYLLDTGSVDESTFADLVASDPDIIYVEFNFTGQDPAPDPGTQSIFFASTRQFYLTQPAWPQIGLGGNQPSAGRGTGTTVAVIDSGVDPNHPAFAPGSILAGRNFLNGSTDIRDIGDGLDNDGDGLIDESVGHGTMVAGVLHYVAPAARILPLKVLDSDGKTTTFRVADAIYFAASSGATVVNLSLGSTADQGVVRDAITHAVAQGLVVVASVGNEGNETPVRFPSGLSTTPGVLAVASVTQSNGRADFSNFGTHVSLVAPGVSIGAPVPGGAYGVADGTSLSAPMVAGVAAMYRARPGATPQSVATIIKNTAANISAANPGYHNMLGTGLLRVPQVTSIGIAPAPRRRLAPPPQPIP